MESFKDVVSGILFEKYPYFRMVDIPKQKDWHSVSDGGTIFWTLYFPSFKYSCIITTFSRIPNSFLRSGNGWI